MYVKHDFVEVYRNPDTIPDIAKPVPISGDPWKTSQKRPPERAEFLVAKYRVMIQRIARSIYRRMATTIDVEDLVQIGTMAMIEAATTCEDRGDLPMHAYLHVRIRGAMIDALRQYAPLARSSMKFRRDVMAAQARLNDELGRPPSDAELAAHFQMDVSHYRAKARDTVSPTFESVDIEDAGYHHQLVDHGPDGFARLEESRFRVDVIAAINALPPVESRVIRHYFLDEMPLADIGHEMGIGASRVCQIKRKALEKLGRSLNGWRD